jgi:hypothetical protein
MSRSYSISASRAGIGSVLLTEIAGGGSFNLADTGTTTELPPAVPAGQKSPVLSASRAGITSVVVTAASGGTFNVVDTGVVPESVTTAERATQVSVEEWVVPVALAQVTQVAIEEWTSSAASPFINLTARVSSRSAARSLVATPTPPRKVDFVLSASRAGIGSVVLADNGSGTYNISDVGVVPEKGYTPLGVGLTARVSSKSVVRSNVTGVTGIIHLSARVSSRSAVRPLLVVPATRAFVTQVSTEEWVVPTPYAQVTQVSIEEWVSIAGNLPITARVTDRSSVRASIIEHVSIRSRVTSRSSVRPNLVAPAVATGDGWLWVLT